MARTIAWVGILGFVAFVSRSASEHTIEAVAFSACVLTASIVAVRTRGGGYPVGISWIPVAWVALILVSEHRIEDPLYRSPLDAAQGNLSLSNVIQLSVYAVVFAMVVHSRRAFVLLRPRRIPKLPLLLFPAFALASALWSPIQAFTIARATQLLVIASLALLMVRIWQFSAELGRSLWRNTVSLWVQAVTVLTLVGFVVRVWPDDRFTWPGIHPGAAATFTAAALLILIVGGRSFAPDPRWTYQLRVLLLGAATYLGQTRSAIAALALGVLAALWALGKERPLARYIGIGYYVLGLVVLSLVAWEQLLEYLARGQGSSALASLNSRVPLWGFAISEITEAGRLILGFGYGAARIILYPAFSWAGTAHNAWVEALIGVGLVGAVLLTWSVCFALWRLGWAEGDARDSRLALVLLVFLLVISMASETLVLPGFGFSVFALVYVVVLGPVDRLQVARPSEHGLAASVRSPGQRSASWPV